MASIIRIVMMQYDGWSMKYSLRFCRLMYNFFIRTPWNIIRIRNNIPGATDISQLYDFLVDVVPSNI